MRAGELEDRRAAVLGEAAVPAREMSELDPDRRRQRVELPQRGVPLAAQARDDRGVLGAERLVRERVEHRRELGAVVARGEDPGEQQAIGLRRALAVRALDRETAPRERQRLVEPALP